MDLENMGGEPCSSVSPTDRFPNISEAGRQLLEVIINPLNRTMPVTKICQIAGISRDSYYRLWKQPEWQAAYRDLCQTTCLSQALSAMQALCQQAALGDVQAGKMVLEMSGLYQPKATIEHTHTLEAGQSLLDLYQSRQKAIDGQ